MNNSAVQKQLQQQITTVLGKRRKVLVALSGGLDSCVLLHALALLRDTEWPDLRVRALYINHGLSPHAEAWSQHCHQFCISRNVPIQTVCVTVDSQKSGLEAAARTARYQALNQHLQPHETLLTAQHLDDQCETFFLALKRSSGPAGLSAMAEKTPFNNNELVRPLLHLSRQQLLDYAHHQQLQWIEDESNQDPRFDRNFLRLNVLPALTERWPHFAHAVARSARWCAEQEQLLDELLAEQLAQLCNTQRALAIEPLREMPAIKRNALLRRWLAGFNALMPSAEQLQTLWQQVALSQQDAAPQLKLGEREIRRFRQHLYCLPLMHSVSDQIIAWHDQKIIQLPDNIGYLIKDSDGTTLRAPQNGEHVTVRFSAQGDVRIVGRSHSRSLKKLWPELGVAPWERERTPLLYFNETLIAAVGIFITEQGKPTTKEDVWQIKWER